jgi:hypothetical protein
MELMIRTNHVPDVVPTIVGQMWFDTVTRVLYLASACTLVADWVPIGGPGSGIGAVLSGHGVPVANPGVSNAIYTDLDTEEMYYWNNELVAWR